MGQDTKWIRGAAGSLIGAIYLLLKFNLYLHREAVTARDRVSAACFYVQSVRSARYAQDCVTGNTLILLESHCSSPKVPTGNCDIGLFIETRN